MTRVTRPAAVLQWVGPASRVLWVGPASRRTGRCAARNLRGGDAAPTGGVDGSDNRSGEWYPQRAPDTGEYDVHNIHSTDWLIDQIVYRLYGLTEEEIGIVERVGTS